MAVARSAQLVTSIEPTLPWPESGSERAASEFSSEDVAGAFVHEARNAVFAVTATLAAFSDDFRDHALGREYDELFRPPLARLAVLMDMLEEHSRPLALEKASIDPRIVARRAVAAASAAEERKVAVRVVASDGVPTRARLDAHRLVRALTSLIEAAVMRSTSGSEVEVVVDSRTAPGPALLRFAIRDSGPTLRPGSCGPAASPQLRGVALHLAHVRRVAVDHGGQVVAQNHPDKGVVVSVILPA